MAGRYALLVACSRYRDRHFNNLITPESDVQALTAALRDNERGGFQVELLQNRSCAEMRIAIDQFFVTRRHDDLVLFYFSGHGLRDTDGRLCLAACDTKFDLLWATSIAADDLRLKMDRCESQQQVVVLDCCYSGAFARGSKGNGEVNSGVAFCTQGEGRVVLTASDATQFAWEGDKRTGTKCCSVFTQFLVEGLQNGAADNNHDGLITVDEWYDYAYERVQQYVKKQGTGRVQTPLKHGTQRGELIIARNPSASTAEVSVEPHTLELLKSPISKARLLAVELLQKDLACADLARQRAAREHLSSLSGDDSRAVAIAAESALHLPSASELPAGIAPLAQHGVIQRTGLSASAHALSPSTQAPPNPPAGITRADWTKPHASARHGRRSVLLLAAACTALSALGGLWIWAHRTNRSHPQIESSVAQKPASAPTVVLLATAQVTPLPTVKPIASEETPPQVSVVPSKPFVTQKPASAPTVALLATAQVTPLPTVKPIASEETPPQVSIVRAESPVAPALPETEPSARLITVESETQGVTTAVQPLVTEKTPSCDPPYSLDRTGLKRFKAECFVK